MNKRMINKSIIDLLIAIIAFSLLLSLSAGELEAVTYCDTLTFGGLSLKDNHTIPLFDPSLGNLIGVDLALELGLLQDFSLENEEPVSQFVDAFSESTLKITTPDAGYLSVNASSSISSKLDAYDGETDFSGPSGRTIEGVASKGSAEDQHLNPSDFVASFQNETISLPASVSIRSETFGTIVFSLSTIAESKICVTYRYEPSGSVDKGDSQ